MTKEKKREVPSFLKKCMAADVYLTNAFVHRLEKFLPFKQLVVHYQILQISCHGIPWIVSLLAFIWIANSKSLYQMQVNLLIGIFLDLIILAVVKAAIRRRRPAQNDDPFTLGPDKYSFPSGHASRSTLVVYFFMCLWPIPMICAPSLLAWSISVCISRLMMRRHYLLDVLGGIILGILEGILLSFIYLSDETCVNLVSWLTEERMEGGEYHV